MIKHTFLTLLAAAAFIPNCGAVPVPAEITRIISEPPPRVIKIGKKGIHPLCVNGKVQMEIVVPADASPSARYAGKMMAEKFS